MAPTDKPRIAKEISHALVYRDGHKVLQQRATQTLHCASDAGGTFLKELLEKYQNELGDLEQPPEGIDATINPLYELGNQPGPLSALLNTKFEQWIGTDKGVSILTKIKLPKDTKKEDNVPSVTILEKIAAAVSPENTPTGITNNKLRKQVLFKNWDPKIAPILAERFLATLQQGQSDAGYTERLAFVIQAIIENQECLEAKYSAQLWAEVQQLFGRLSDANARLEIHKAVLVFAGRSPVTGPQQDAKSFALQNWQGFTDKQLRDTIGYLKAFPIAVGDELQKALLQQELSLVQNELKSPTDRTRQRVDLCFENRELIAPNSVDSFLLKALETPDSAFDGWQVTLAEYSGKLESIFRQQIAEKCLSLVTGSHSQARRQAFVELFSTVLPAIEEAIKPRLLQLYFGLCKHQDSNVRNPAATILGRVRDAVDEQDFKLGLNTLMREICRMTPSEVAGYRPLFDAALEHSALFGDYEWRDLGDLSKRSIQQADAGLQDFGLLLVERMPKIPADHDADLIHLLVGIAGGTNSAQKERSDKILRKIPESDLNATARQTLQEYLAPPEQRDGSSS